MKKILYPICVFILLISSATTSFAITVEEVPNPQTARGSFVQDSGDVLGAEYSALIDNVARKLKNATSAELAVVTVDNLNDSTVEDYAARLFKRFGVGEKDKDNGVLILFSRDDRKVRIEVGYGLEGDINDAKAGRFLDKHAIPSFKKGEYGRGLYETTKAVAASIADSLGKPLSFPDPATWPKQVTLPASTSTKVQSKIPIGVFWAMLGYLIFFIGITALGLLLLALRIKLKKAKAAKVKALGHGAVLPITVWFFGGFVMIVLGNLTGAVFLPIAVFMGTAALSTFMQFKLRKRLKKQVADYQLECPSCHHKMSLLDEAEDDSFLSVEEVAEEKAGGMDYEFWKCEPCDQIERLEVKIGKASKCPKCSHLTLTKFTKTLQAATTSSRGRIRITQVCQNPKCDYRHEEERTTAKLSSSGSSSGRSFSSGGSFGGGSSGGGGASRGW